MPVLCLVVGYTLAPRPLSESEQLTLQRQVGMLELEMMLDVEAIKLGDDPWIYTKLLADPSFWVRHRKIKDVFADDDGLWLVDFEDRRVLISPDSNGELLYEYHNGTNEGDWFVASKSL